MNPALGSFEPTKSGSYSVEVQRDGDPYPGSPFQIKVTEGQLPNPAKVKATGSIEKALANEWNELKVNLSDAGTCINPN